MSFMDASQPIIRTRRRTRQVDPSLSRFVDSGSGDRVATRNSRKRSATTKPNLLLESNPQSPLTDDDSRARERSRLGVGDFAREDLSILESLASALEESSLASEGPEETLVLPSQHLGSTPLAGPTTAEVITARRRRNITTYKQRRSLRLHPTEDENKITLRSRQVTRSITTPTSTPSCSPVPTHATSKSRKRRRRQPPLKHRLVRAARSRLPKNESQDVLSQPPIAVLLEPAEEDAQSALNDDASFVAPEDEPVAVPEPDTTQRRLAAPQNFTIPDLKDLLSAKSQPFPVIPANEPGAEFQRKPLPQFVRPTNNQLHSPKPRLDPKRGRPGRRDMPRLNFVALDAHQEQVTGRSSDKRPNPSLALHQVPLISQAPPTSVIDDDTIDTPPTPALTRVNFLTPGQIRSPSRIFVKGTPEPDVDIPRVYPNIAEGPSFLKSKASPARRTQIADDLSEPASNSVQPSNRSLAPMTDLLDDLTRLARSAAQMNNKLASNVADRSNLKRTHQVTLTKDGYLSHLASDIGTPAKIRRLE
ncbi:hypothetical protein FRC12_011426 [Ceratobasidium sp. 428]|nr:hypothetical protein FRC12_011426 [Ceratobasidium sp. 428]